MNINELKKTFKERFNGEGTVYTSPGRVNLIGEHTDYNGGFVFPGAIDKGIYACIRLNGTQTVKAYSMDYQQYSEFGLREEDKPAESWARYIFGVCREIQKRGYAIQGFDTAFFGNVPLGAGMSSSAALESTFAFALNDLLNLGIDKFELARIGQSTEHNYCGVKCGIMDQFASLFGKAGHLMRLNCATMEFEYFPFHPQGYKLVLLDTVVKHELASSAYNRRRESCENACRHIAARHPEVKSLSDATMAMLNEVDVEIPAEDYMRAEYVIGEKQRVLDVCDALEKGDYETVGQCMYGTHYGMSKLYEVSCDELDYLNDIAKECGVTGSRVMGGGFGGCTINLVKDALYDRFIATAKEKFNARFGHEPKVYDVVISDGARKIQPMKPTLLVLAAGMGSRYGALKQMDGVGPNNEAILDYSIFDAKRAGFGKVVFVIREDFAEAFKKVNNTEKFGIPVEYVYQSLDKLPEGFNVPEGRVKPWGTCHAVLMAKDVIHEPFAAINADDFYGKEAYEVLAKYLMECEGKQGAYSMVAYKLRNTMSDFGTVSRGICTADNEGHLQTIVERTAIGHTDDGGAAYTDETGSHPLDMDSLVSMNFFGFTPDFFAYSEKGFVEFLKGPAQTNLKAEFFIPLMVNQAIHDGTAKLKVLSSNASWFGVTYKEDKPDVMRKIRELIEKGVYPKNLW